MRILLLFVGICTAITLNAQTKYPVRKTLTFKGGSILLAESIDSVTDKDTLHHNIQGICLNERSEKVWEMNDHILKEQEESSIWFWTKFCTVKDLDGDGQVDPVIVYGTDGLNGNSDGRVKVLVYYKGVKSAIRHQNSEMDGGRYSDIDASFYTLPEPVQQYVKKLLLELTEQNLVNYDVDFRQKMNKKATHIQ
jgi:hypothetical protein